MGPNEVELVRVWTREPGGEVSSLVFYSDSDFEVVVDCETGRAVHGTGGSWGISICVRDLYENKSIYTEGRNGVFGDDFWSSQRGSIIFRIPAPTAEHEWHACEVIAQLVSGGVGLAAPDVSLARSPLFCIISP